MRPAPWMTPRTIAPEAALASSGAGCVRPRASRFALLAQAVAPTHKPVASPPFRMARSENKLRSLGASILLPISGLPHSSITISCPRGPTRPKPVRTDRRLRRIRLMSSVSQAGNFCEERVVAMCVYQISRVLETRQYLSGMSSPRISRLWIRSRPLLWGRPRGLPSFLSA